jgi:hypothetical protein
MKVKNVSGLSRTIASTGQTVEHDGEVEVSDGLGRSLCEQPVNWEPVKPPSKTTKTKNEEGDN